MPILFSYCQLQRQEQVSHSASFETKMAVGPYHSSLLRVSHIVITSFQKKRCSNILHMHMCCNSSSLRLHGFSRPCPFRTQRNACPAEAVTGRFRRFIITSDSHGEMRSSTNQRRNHPQINGVLPKKKG